MRYYRIADITISTDYSGDAVCSYMQKYEVRYTKDVDIEINIQPSLSITLPQDVEVFKEKYYRRYAYNSKGDYILYDILEDTGEVTSYIEISRDLSHANMQVIDLQRLGGASIDVRSFNMIGEVVRIVACHRGYICFHASAISYRGDAILISAPSGTGKSTHADMWVRYRGATILNDDCPMIVPVEDGYRVYGTPWSGKTFINDNKYAYLKAVVFLRRSDEPYIEDIEVADRRGKYLAQSYLYPYNAMTLATLETLGKIYHNIPTYLLGANMSIDTLNVAYEGIYNENQR